MTAYIIRRLLSAIPVLLLVSVFVFLLIHLAPGDPAGVIAGRMATPEQVARIRAELGLDQPIGVQFVDWFTGLLTGDFGRSIFYDVPVTVLMAQRLEPSLSLTFGTLFVAIAVAVPAGVAAARFKGGHLDKAIMAFSSLGFSIPVFVIAYLLIYAFSVSLRLFPVQGYSPIGEGVAAWLHSIALPSLSLGLIFAALIARVTRATMVDVLAQDYILAAAAKGFSRRYILWRHALRNAAIPIVTVIGTSFVMLVGGVVVTETVFNIPGLGRLVVGAIAQRDFPVIQGMILIFAGIYVLINLLIDLLYTVIDPRIRY